MTLTTISTTETFKGRRRPTERLHKTAIAPGEPVNLAPDGPVDIVDPDGILLAAVRRFPDPDMFRLIRGAVLRLPWQTSARSGGMKSSQRTFGNSPRYEPQGRDACFTALLGLEAPAVARVLIDAAAPLWDLLEQAAPDRAAECEAQPIHPDWFLPGTAWTSGNANRSSSLRYHHDYANTDTWSAMLMVRTNVTGGALDIADFGISLPCNDGDVIMFNGHAYEHGVTPMTITDPTRNAYRVSLVYYQMNGMKRCLCADDEIAYAQAARTKREAWMADDAAARGTIPT